MKECDNMDISEVNRIKDDVLKHLIFAEEITR